MAVIKIIAAAVFLFAVCSCETSSDTQDMLRDIITMAKALKAKGDERHWKINDMVDDVQCMQNDFFGLKQRVEVLKGFQKERVKENAMPLNETLNDIEECLEEVKETLEEVEGFQHPCGGPGWRRILYLDRRDPNSNCLGSSWSSGTFDCFISSDETCLSESVPVTEPYYQVCGQARGIAAGDVGGFRYYYENLAGVSEPAVGDLFAAGLILSSGSDHVWSFIAGTEPGNANDANSTSDINKCPCENGEEDFIDTNGDLPSIVGNDYYCESTPTEFPDPGDEFSLDYKLWDGLNCKVGSQCCNDGTPPIFTKTLPSSRTNPIVLNLCNENVGTGLGEGRLGITFIELYVR